jgi:hypothetical protein
MRPYPLPASIQGDVSDDERNWASPERYMPLIILEEMYREI